MLHASSLNCLGSLTAPETRFELSEIPRLLFPVRAGTSSSDSLCTYMPVTESKNDLGTPLADRSATTPATTSVASCAFSPKDSSTVGKLFPLGLSEVSTLRKSFLSNILSTSSASIASTTTSVLAGSSASGVLAATDSSTS